MKELDIAKFGGTSVGTYEAMESSYKVAVSNPATRVVVASACSGVTNILVELASGACNAQKIDENLGKLSDIHSQIIEKLGSPKELSDFVQSHLKEIRNLAFEANMGRSDELTDRIVSNGELMSTYIFAWMFNHFGTKAVWFDVRRVMRTDSQFGCAAPMPEVVRSLCQEQLTPLVSGDAIVVTQGFIAQNSVGQTTTLGRGGSDFSAALLGEALDATSISIWTDVPGVYTTDPRLVPHAKCIPELTYNEAAEMATFGAKILHPSTLVPAVRRGIPVYVGSSREPDKGGTWVRLKTESHPAFRAVALRKNQSLIVLSSPKMVGASGFLAKVFEVFARYKRSVDLVTTSEVSIAITLDAGTNTSGVSHAIPDDMLEELRGFCHVKVESGLSLVAIIGNKMADIPGLTSDALSAISDFPVKMICYGASSHNLCFLLNADDAPEALVKIHRHLLEK